VPKSQSLHCILLIIKLLPPAVPIETASVQEVLSANSGGSSRQPSAGLGAGGGGVGSAHGALRSVTPAEIIVGQVQDGYDSFSHGMVIQSDALKGLRAGKSSASFPSPASSFVPSSLDPSQAARQVVALRPIRAPTPIDRTTDRPPPRDSLESEHPPLLAQTRAFSARRVHLVVGVDRVSETGVARMIPSERRAVRPPGPRGGSFRGSFLIAIEISAAAPESNRPRKGAWRRLCRRPLAPSRASRPCCCCRRRQNSCGRAESSWSLRSLSLELLVMVVEIGVEPKPHLAPPDRGRLRRRTGLAASTMLLLTMPPHTSSSFRPGFVRVRYLFFRPLSGRDDPVSSKQRWIRGCERAGCCISGRLKGAKPPPQGWRRRPCHQAGGEKGEDETIGGASRRH
jgi:hypothetical protein